jgi:hypothetical protein
MFNYCVFEPKNAPKDIASFLSWIGFSSDEDDCANEYYEKCENDEEAIAGISSSLRNLFWDLCKFYPPYLSDVAEGKIPEGISENQEIIYDFSPEWIIVSFHAGLTDSLYKKLFSLAAKNGVGFIDLNNSDILWIPDEDEEGTLKIAEKVEDEDYEDCCHFCDKKRISVKKLFAGTKAYICNECVNLCAEILNDENNL